MNKIDREKLVQHWIDFHIQPCVRPEDNPKYYALDKLDDLCRKEPSSAWVIILSILEKDTSDTILSNVSAGPLENIIVFNGETYISKIEAEAKKIRFFVYV